MNAREEPVPAATFSVAHNPDPASKLGYLIRLPLDSGALVLKAAEPWPRTAKVYCHRAEAWPERADIIEEVPVRSCVRRGQAVDLVLDRARETRSQIIFTTVKGREAIFWQSPKTTRRSRPGVRVPARRASGTRDIAIAVDTRERYPFRFTTSRPRPTGGRYPPATMESSTTASSSPLSSARLSLISRTPLLTGASPTPSQSSPPLIVLLSWSRTVTAPCSRSHTSLPASWSIC